MKFGAVLWLVGCWFFTNPVLAQEFTYQGRLMNQGVPYTGSADFLFQVWTAQSGGQQVGPGFSIAEHPVTDGLFQVQLEFGRRVFDGSPRYLATRVNGAWLSPRQPITPAPLALHALSADGVETVWSLAGNDIHYLDGRVGIGRLPSDFVVIDSGMNAQDEDYSFGTGALRVMIRDPDTGGGLTKFRVLGNGGVAIGNSFNSSGVPSDGLRVQGGMRVEGNSEFGRATFSQRATFESRVSIGTTGLSTDALHVGGTTRTEVLRITGGSDLAERFDIIGTDHHAPKPGMVVSIHPQQPGRLQLSQLAYDTRVAGVISGANGINSGMIMGQEGSIADGEYAVALTGRVYVRVDASSRAVVPGDLLTTSDRVGHAMAVADHGRMHGAVIGKAMTGLDIGQVGLVMVLVNLQ